MTTNFNSVQMFKSSDDCNKYSKSVSYETLVGGTTTTGRGIKQTRRVFLSSAIKPLSAVGTLTSLLCNSAKVMEKLLHRHSEPKAKNPKKTGTVIIGRGCEPIISAESKRDPRLIATQSPRMTDKALSLSGASSEKQKESSLILRKAKFQAIFKFVLPLASKGTEGIKYNRISAFVSMPVLLIRRSLEKFFKKNFRDDRLFLGFAKILALLFTFATISESWADDVIPTSGTCNDAGTCLWSIDSAGTLTISAEDGAKDVKMANYNCQANPCDQSTLISRPWEASLQQIKSVVIGDNITHIGNDAFQAATNLTSVTGMKDVKTIGDKGVFAFTGLTSITIPEGVTHIGSWAFSYNDSLTSITIPDSVTHIRDYAFEGASSLASITIPDSVTYLGTGAFYDASSLESITIPDNIDTSNWDAEAFEGLPGNTKNIVCQGGLNTCYEKLAKYFTEEDCPQNLINAGKGNLCSCSDSCISPSLVTEATKDQCGGEYTWDENSTPKCRHMKDDECANSAKYYYSDGQCKSMPGSKTKCKNADFLWSESSCVKSCASGFVEWDKECLSEYPFAKKRWTPAEANQWLHDGNDNFVIITFKK